MKEQTSGYVLPYDIKIQADIKMISTHKFNILHLKPNSLEETNSLANQSVDLRTFFPV